jgi:U3 small nucleolar RNA-associated protein 23
VTKAAPEDKKKKKRNYGPKGPNPLSIKKKKSTTQQQPGKKATTSKMSSSDAVQADTSAQQKAKRKRKKKNAGKAESTGQEALGGEPTPATIPVSSVSGEA